MAIFAFNPGLTGFQKNILSWATFGHANVNLFRAFHEEEGKVLLVYAHLPGETLAAYLGKDPLTDARRVELATETAQGLLYLHTRDPPMWHGNVHPVPLGNIVIGVKGNPILTDYGIYTTADQANGVGLTKTDDRGGQVGALGFSPDGLLIAVALSHVVQFFSTDTWKVALELALPVQCHMPCIRFSPSGSLFALGLGNVNYVVWVWDLRSGTLQKTFSGMTYTVSGVDISRDDSLIAASSLAGEVRLWRLGDEEAKVLSEPSETDIAYTVTILSEGDLVAAGFREGGVRIWDVQTGSLVATLESPASAPVMCTQLSPDGCWLFSSGSEVIPWDVRTIRTKGFHSVENSIPHLNTRRLRAPGPISPVSISPDNVWMAAIAANSGNVHVVQPENPESARSSIGQVPAQGIRRLLFIPNDWI
ncbi:hypothetical protein FRB99_001383 [Tulasnella sp. 403]|nr:hypothetical protein FRB99_001383 [Tulasnella sp. 403]